LKLKIGGVQTDKTNLLAERLNLLIHSINHIQ